MSPGAWSWDVSQGQGGSQESSSDRAAAPAATYATETNRLLPALGAGFAVSEKLWQEDGKSTSQAARSLAWDV